MRGDAEQAASLMGPAIGIRQKLIRALVLMLHEGEAGAREAAKSIREALGMDPALDLAVCDHLPPACKGLPLCVLSHPRVRAVLLVSDRWLVRPSIRHRPERVDACGRSGRLQASSFAECRG